MIHRVRVWDLPVRLFHWALAACVVALVATAYLGAMLWHERLGYAVAALLVFRLVWGLVGGHWSRFASFVYAPRSLSAYLRGQSHPDHLVGHNPLGALSVFAMLAVLAVQVGTGLVSDDEIAFLGPLNRFVATDTALAATSYHRNIGQWLVIGLVALHVAAVLFYLLKKRDNLIRPMLTGDKHVPGPAPSSRDDAVSRLAAAAVLGLSAALVTWVVGLGT